MQYDLAFYPDEKEKEYVVIEEFVDHNTLQGILNFCHQFTNYDELVEFIYYMGAIEEPTQNGVFKIHSRTSKKSSPKVFAKGITYKDEARFYNPEYLEYYYVEQILKSDFTYELINKYFSFFLSRSNAAAEHLYSMRYHINNYVRFGGIIDSPDQPNIFESTRDFVRTFSHRVNSKNEYVVHYPNLTLLARYAANYRRKTKNFNPNNSQGDINNKIDSTIENLKNQINHYNTLLLELDETDEAYKYYDSIIRDLQEKLDFILLRRNHNETTRH